MSFRDLSDYERVGKLVPKNFKLETSREMLVAVLSESLLTVKNGILGNGKRREKEMEKLAFFNVEK